MVESSRISCTVPRNIIAGTRLRILLLIAGICFNSIPLQAQVLERKPGYLIGGEIGVSNVATEMGDGDVNDTGPAIGIRIGRRFSNRFSLILEYSIHHFDDESPQTSDLRIDTTIIDGKEIYEISSVETSKVFQTSYLLLLVQYYFYRGFYFRISPGVGWHRFASYTFPGGEVLDAGTSSEIGIAFGLAAGYEHQISRSLAISLETLARWSGGEDSTNPRRVIGVNAGITWYFKQ